MAPLLLVADRVVPESLGEWGAVIALGVLLTGLSGLAVVLLQPSEARVADVPAGVGSAIE